MAREQQLLHHFSHKHPLTLVEKEEENAKEEYRSSLLCYGCTGKISVPYYHCEEDCPFFCLHQVCADLPMRIKVPHYGCHHYLQQAKCLRHDQSNQRCDMCDDHWYRFSYVCFQCRYVIDIRCAMKFVETKLPFHSHPVYPLPPNDFDHWCLACHYLIKGVSYGCKICQLFIHLECASLPMTKESSPAHPHRLRISYNPCAGAEICQICGKKIYGWAYFCEECEYMTHAHDCKYTQRSRHKHPVVLVDKALDPSDLEDCYCCGEKISSTPYYACKDCPTYHLHQLCGEMPLELNEHQMHPKCSLKLLTDLPFIAGLDWRCSVCLVECNGFAYHCPPCNFVMDTICAMKALTSKHKFHPQHPLSQSVAKGFSRCHACNRNSEGTSFQCITCQFWVHEQCASFPRVKTTSFHEDSLKLIYGIPETFAGMVVNCGICAEVIKHHNWAYHCHRCRYFTHIHDCSTHIDSCDVDEATKDAIHLPLPNEVMFESKVTTGSKIVHHRHPMILFADQFESNAIDITPFLVNLIRGSATWPTLRIDGKDYIGFSFSFYCGKLSMQITSVELPRYINHEGHTHPLKNTFLNTFTRCNACEQSFFGCGFKCVICAFTVDTYCASLPKAFKHKYDKHTLPLTYSSIEGVEEYVCEICEEDVLPRWFYHCVDCDQSIHGRCMWRAFIEFDGSFRLSSHSCLLTMVPSSKDLPDCIICNKKETFGHGFAFLCKACKFMVHLTCTFEDELEEVYHRMTKSSTLLQVPIQRTGD